MSVERTNVKVTDLGEHRGVELERKLLFERDSQRWRASYCYISARRNKALVIMPLWAVIKHSKRRSDRQWYANNARPCSRPVRQWCFQMRQYTRGPKPYQMLEPVSPPITWQARRGYPRMKEDWGSAASRGLCRDSGHHAR
jgi:hypothetical protein